MINIVFDKYQILLYFKYNRIGVLRSLKTPQLKGGTMQYLVNLLCLIVALGYASEMVVTDVKLKHMSPQFLTLCYAAGVAVFAAIVLLFSKEKTLLPTTTEWGFIGMMILFSFIAALSHFAALNLNAGSIKLSMSYAMLPAVASILSAIFKGEKPPPKMWLAWILLVIVVYLVSTSNKAVEDGIE